MSLVDWNKFDPEYKWATHDKDGIWVHVNEPIWDSSRRAYYSGLGSSVVDSFSEIGIPVKEPRQANTVGDPPAIIPVIKKTLDLLDYLAFETSPRPSPEDRLKIVDHMRALSKALKEWENY